MWLFYLLKEGSGISLYFGKKLIRINLILIIRMIKGVLDIYVASGRGCFEFELQQGKLFYHYYLHLNVYVSLFLKCIIVYFYSYKNDVVVSLLFLFFFLN